MDINELKNALEAVLFSLGDAVEAGRLAEAFGVSQEDISIAAKSLQEDLLERGSAISIIEIDGAYQMCTRKEMYGYLLKIIAVPKDSRLTDAQLETLSIIAYKQPVTKLEIENIRGVNSDYIINRLAQLGLIEESGRLDAPGRPFQFVTTMEFLRRFGLRSLDELPDADQETMDAFAAEAENETGYDPEDEEKAEEK